MSKAIQCLCLVVFFLAFVLAEEDSHDHDHSDEHDDEFHTTDIDLDGHEHDDHEEDAGLAMAITVAAGFAAFLGASSMFCVKREQVGVIPATLGFSSGVVVYLSFVNLIPECVELLNHAGEYETEALPHLFALLCVIAGIAIAFVSDRCCAHHHHEECPMDSNPKPESNDKQSTPLATDDAVNGDAIEMDPMDQSGSVVDLPSNDDEDGAKPQNLSRLSYSIAFALILHHLPEGIATFISLYYDFEFGVLVTFALVIHDVPSGICIAVPTYFATGSMIKPLLLCLAAAAAYPIGGLIGWAVVESASDAFVDSFIGVLFGVTGGIMLYIAFVELLPTAIMTAKRLSMKEQYKSIYRWTLGGIFVGFLVMDISTILLAQTGGHSH